MNSKPDIEYEERGDISLLFEIITNSMYWQESCKWRKLAIISHTNELCILSRISINASKVDCQKLQNSTVHDMI